MRAASAGDSKRRTAPRTYSLSFTSVFKAALLAVGIALAVVIAAPPITAWLQSNQALNLERHCAKADDDPACRSTAIGRIRALPQTGDGTREALILVMRPVIRDVQSTIGSEPSQLIAETEAAEACISDSNAAKIRGKVERFVLTLASNRSNIDALTAAFDAGSAAKNAKTPLGQLVPDALTWGGEVLSVSEPLARSEVASGFLSGVLMACGD